MCVDLFAMLACIVVFLIPPVAAKDTEAEKNRIRALCPGITQWEAHRKVISTGDRTFQDESNPRLRDELMAWADQDQSVRNIAAEEMVKRAQAALQDVMNVDVANLVRLRNVIASDGVPTLHMVGPRGMNALWVLVQHADGDLELQDRVLKALSNNNQGLPMDQIALLTDRVLVNQGKAQRYGSQFHRVNGAFVLDPVEDEAHLPERRESVGLMPLSAYECVLRVSYGSR
jgi:hypothetical protein